MIAATMETTSSWHNWHSTGNAQCWSSG